MTFEPVDLKNPNPVMAFMVIDAHNAVRVLSPTAEAAEYALTEFAIEGGRVIEVDLRELMRKNAAERN